MSNLLFPSTLPGLQIDIQREADYDVKTQWSLSRKRLDYTYETYPLTKYTVGFEVLRSDSSLSNRARELQQALTHIARHYGQLDSFLLVDPADSSVTDHGFAVGDGTTASFQLQRTLAGDVIDAAGFEYGAQTKPYTNVVKNSSFETDTNADGTADSWGVYNNASATEPAILTIVPGANGGKAQRVSWGINAGSTKGITQSGVTKIAGQWYTVSFLARASGSNVGKFFGLGWNTSPSTGADVAIPALSASWQRYVFQVFWNLGVTPDPDLFITISTAVGAAWHNATASGSFGDLDFDLVQVVKGQHGVTDFQPIETPAAATGTRTPSYWPGYADGYEPIFDLNGDVTIYEDGTWRGRRTLYPFTRTNLLPWSEQFDNAGWTKTNVTIAANATTAPDGTSTADQFNEGAAVTVTHVILQNTSPAETQGELRCYAAFVKANNLPNIVWRTQNSGIGINFNLGTGIIDGTIGGPIASGVITDPRWPGWYRIWFINRVTASLGTGAILQATPDATYSLAGYTGTSRTFYVWGAMCERVSNLNGPTPYIPTPSSAAVTVTDYTLSATASFTPVAVPVAGTFYSADMNFYRRVRFAQQSLPVEQLVQSMWQAKSLALISVKP